MIYVFFLLFVCFVLIYCCVKTFFLLQTRIFLRFQPINPFTYGGGGGLYAFTSVVFCPLLKLCLGNPYLKILYFQNFLLRMPLRKNSFTLFQSTLKYGSKNCPQIRGLRVILFPNDPEVFFVPFVMCNMCQIS